MTNQQRLSAYVDYHILDLMARAGMSDQGLIPEWNAMMSIWQRFKEDRISLLTSVDEMELDFVIHMNRGGLCVTDTFQITDNIDDFERWELADRGDTNRWRAIVELYDQLETISGHDDLVGEHTHPHFCEQVAHVLKERPTDDAAGPAPFDQEMVILRDCAAVLHDVYDAGLWADLKHIQYGLNWKVLQSVLPKYSRSATLNDEGASLNKNLLGLLNRLVNIGKKSCPRLPMQDRHIDFVLGIVRKKYCQEDIDRSVSHIAHCLRNDIDCYLTTDAGLADKFAGKRQNIQLALGTSVHLEVLLPTQLEKRLKT